jgi:hypothetical protein
MEEEGQKERERDGEEEEGYSWLTGEEGEDSTWLT